MLDELVFSIADTLPVSGLSVTPNTAELDATGVSVGVGFSVGEGVGVLVGVGVRVGMGVGVDVHVGCGVGVGVFVGSGVGVGVGPVMAIVVSELQVGELQLEVYRPTLNK